MASLACYNFFFRRPPQIYARAKGRAANIQLSGKCEISPPPNPRIASRGTRVDGAGAGRAGDVLTLLATSRVRYNLFLGVLLRSTHVLRGVLETRNFRAGAKLVLRRPPDSREGGLENPALGGARGGSTYPPHDFPRRVHFILWHPPLICACDKGRFAYMRFSRSREISISPTPRLASRGTRDHGARVGSAEDFLTAALTSRPSNNLFLGAPIRASHT